MYNPMATSIDTKVFHCSCGNLSSPGKGSIDHKCPDSLDNVGEHSNSANTGESSEVKKEHILVSTFPTKSNVSIALHRLRGFNALRIIGVLCLVL